MSLQIFGITLVRLQGGSVRGDYGVIRYGEQEQINKNTVTRRGVTDFFLTCLTIQKNIGLELDFQERSCECPCKDIC